MSPNSNFVVVALVSVAVLASAVYIYRRQPKPAATLYDSLGGAPTFDKLVDVFYGYVLADPLLAPAFKNVDMVRQKKMQHSFLAHVFGARPYNGKGMREAHKKMGLTDAHFDAVLACLKKALTDLGVDTATQKIVLGTTETTRNDVLGRD